MSPLERMAAGCAASTLGRRRDFVRRLRRWAAADKAQRRAMRYPSAWALRTHACFALAALAIEYGALFPALLLAAVVGYALAFFMLFAG